MLDLMMQDQDFMKFQEDMLADFEDDMVDELQQVRGKPMRLCIYVCVCVCVCVCLFVCLPLCLSVCVRGTEPVYAVGSLVPNLLCFAPSSSSSTHGSATAAGWPPPFAVVCGRQAARPP